MRMVMQVCQLNYLCDPVSVIIFVMLGYTRGS